MPGGMLDGGRMGGLGGCAWPATALSAAHKPAASQHLGRPAGQQNSEGSLQSCDLVILAWPSFSSSAVFAPWFPVDQPLLASQRSSRATRPVRHHAVPSRRPFLIAP